MAAALKAAGIWHGRRLTSPCRNSGGTTMTSGPGSAAYQRRTIGRQATSVGARPLRPATQHTIGSIPNRRPDDDIAYGVDRRGNHFYREI